MTIGGGTMPAAGAAMGRRAMLAGLFASPLLGAGRADPLLSRLRAIEGGTGGRLGVCASAGGGWCVGWRENALFPLCSTFKLLLAGCVLSRCDRGEERPDAPVRIAANDILAHAPETTRHIGGAMTVAALARAAIVVSDNGAANLLLARIGGPPGLTRFLRSLGDGVTRLDRIEPLLNEAAPGDPRDTTSPRAMADTARALLFGGALSPSSRAALRGWMAESGTGAARLRAGAPAGWRAGDKTGTGANDTVNDVAFLIPPGGEPVLIAAYLTGATVSPVRREAALAEVARAVCAVAPYSPAPDASRHDRGSSG